MNLFSILWGLTSALSWGAADFIGGITSKKSQPYQVLFLSELGGLLPLLVVTLLFREPIPPLSTWLWSGLASTLGTFGLLILYRALADGQMSITAPVSALLAALVPVIIGTWTQGIPRGVTLSGFGLALVSIWTISQHGEGANWRVGLRALRWPFLAGLFFGLYFVLIHQSSQQAFFWPLLNARLVGTLIMVGYVVVKRGSPLPRREIWSWVVLGGSLDVAGNVFYLLAAHAGRMDVAAVLGSLYPASTVLLAHLLLKEKVNRIQSVGIGFAFAAIVLLTI